MKGWIGVDLDGTLAYYEEWKGLSHIGEPVQPMLERVKRWLADGKDVRIFTARASSSNGIGRGHAISVVESWCEKHIGQKLTVTCEKDFGMVELWDDRCIQVARNEGNPVHGK